MFGLFRYVLAMFVVYGHYVPVHPEWIHRFNWFGHYAVWAFYLLSGYLMTLVLCQRYPTTVRGVGRYLANRALRIYPPYWAALVISLVAIIVSADASRAMGPKLRLPIDLSGWLQNLFILGLHNPQSSRMITPAWSLSVELIFYGVMGVSISKYRDLAIAWLGFSLVLVWASDIQSGVAWVGSLEGASLCFSLGAVVYHLKDWRPPAWFALPAAGLFTAHAVLAPVFYDDVWGIGLFVSVGLAAVVVASLSRVDARSMPLWFARSDRVLGDLAYPIFLCHVQVGALTLHAFFGDRRPDSGWLLILVALPAIHVISYAIHRLCEAPLISLRDRIRPGGRIRAISPPPLGE